MLVRRLWEGPWWFCLIEKWSVMLLLVVWQCQGLTLVDLKQLPFDHRTTQRQNPTFTFLWDNDRTTDAPMEWLGHFWVIWSHLLAQNPLFMLGLGKFSFEAVPKSWPITTDPPTTPLKSAKFGIFSNVGQMPLGRPLMVLLDWKVVSNASVGCLGVPGVDFGWYETTSLWPPNHPTPKPNFYLSLR